MRRIALGLLALLSLAVIQLLAASTSHAVQYPWCAQYASGFGGENCGFTTQEQCMETVRGNGGFCVPNPSYTAPTKPAGSKRKRH